MHIYDLALLVSNEDFITFSDEHSLPPQMDIVRHICIIDDKDYPKNLLLCKSKRILTVYTVNNLYRSHFTSMFNDLFKQWKSIRVLVLADRNITEIPDCINELKHLRYLDVSETEVISLPDSLFELYNLQTLALPCDVRLPRKNVWNLINLRHLRGASKTTLKVIAQLTSLQELTVVTVYEGDCISELRHLRGLRGKLDIHGLENVKSSQDAAQAMMQEKVFIDHQSLLFTVDEKRTLFSEECRISEKNVLEALNCPPNLKSLSIYGYIGDQFPSWLTDASNSMRFLSSFYIECCEVVELMKLDAFVSLKQLNVRSCSNLQRIRLANEVAATIQHLSIEGCRELREMEIKSLPSLRELRIRD